MASGKDPSAPSPRRVAAATAASDASGGGGGGAGDEDPIGGGPDAADAGTGGGAAAGVDPGARPRGGRNASAAYSFHTLEPPRGSRGGSDARGEAAAAAEAAEAAAEAEAAAAAASLLSVARSISARTAARPSLSLRSNDASSLATVTARVSTFRSRAAIFASHARAAFSASSSRVGAAASDDATRVSARCAASSPRIAVTGAATEEPNEFGVKGGSVAFQGTLKISNNQGCGQHGGLGTYEQSPFAMARGPLYQGGTKSGDPTCTVDLAPTVLRHLGLDYGDVDGAPLP